MARFLSSEWFDEVARCAPQPPTNENGTSDADLVLEQVVRDTGDGEVRYRVVVASGQAYIQTAGINPPDPAGVNPPAQTAGVTPPDQTAGVNPPDQTGVNPPDPAGVNPPDQTGVNPPDLTITCDWATATAMAQGHLSAQTALMDGRLRVRGNLARLAGCAADLVGLDPVPAEVRHQTTY